MLFGADQHALGVHAVARVPPPREKMIQELQRRDIFALLSLCFCLLRQLIECARLTFCRRLDEGDPIVRYSLERTCRQFSCFIGIFGRNLAHFRHVQKVDCAAACGCGDTDTAVVVLE